MTRGRGDTVTRREDLALFHRVSASPRLRVSLSPRLRVSVSPLACALALALVPLNTALLLIGGGVLAFALLCRPEIAVYLLIVAVPFGSLMPLPLGGANVTAADGLVALALALYLARGVARRRIDIRIPSLVLPLLVFILAASFSVLVALSLNAALKELVKWIEMLSIYWLVAQELRREQLPRALAALFLAGLAEAAVGIYQSYFQVGPEGFLLFGGTDLRAFGTFDQPNPFAGYLGLVIPLAWGVAVGLVVDRARTGERVWRHALLVLACVSLGALLVALYFSFSRGAWLGVSAALVVTTIVRSRRAALVAFSVAALVVVVALLGQLNLVPDVISARFSTVGDYFGFQDVRGVTVNDNNYAIVERMAHWQAAWEMFSDHPWRGIGIGNYAVVYPVYALPHWDDPLGHAHNYYLNVLAETRLIGLAAYGALWLAVFWSAWRTVRSTRGFYQGVAAGALGVLVALSVHNLFDNLFVHSMHIQVGITLGMLASLKEV